MEFCMQCKKKFDIEDERCPNCDSKLYEISMETDEGTDEYEAAEIVSTMMFTGII